MPISSLFSAPPLAHMTLEHADVSAGHMQMKLAPAERIGGGFTAAFGVTFASTAAKMLRSPFPWPFKLVPAAFLALGAGIGAYGASRATAEYRIRVERGRGVTYRWRVGPTAVRELRVAPEDIASFDVTVHHHTRSSGPSEWPHRAHEWTETEHRLVLVTRRGVLHAVDRFSTRAQAELRKKMIEDVLA